MYSPDFSELAAVSVRRLAWAMETTMGKAVDAIVSLLPGNIDPAKVCIACKDTSKCKACIFKSCAVTSAKIVDLLK